MSDKPIRSLLIRKPNEVYWFRDVLQVITNKMTNDGINWNPPIGNSCVYLTSEAIARHSIVPSFSEFLSLKDAELSAHREQNPPQESGSFYKETIHDVREINELYSTLSSLLNQTKSAEQDQDEIKEAGEKTGTAAKSGALWADIAVSGDKASTSSRSVLPDNAHAAGHKQRSGVVVAIREPFPRPSWLTQAENSAYLKLYKKFLNGIPSGPAHKGRKDIAKFKELQGRVLAEQDEFNKYLEHAARSYDDLYAYIHHQAQTFLDGLTAQLEMNVKRYPQCYTMLDAVPLVPPRLPLAIPFIHMQTLLRMGVVPKVIIPTIKETAVGPKLPLNAEMIHEKFPHTCPRTAEQNKSPSSQPVSADTNARKLSEKYLPHVVISSAGLQCLMDNQAPHYPNQWELPVEVRRCSFREDGQLKTHHVVFIDKPLPPKLTTKRSKNTWYHKYALKSSLQHPKHQASLTFTCDKRTISVNRTSHESQPNPTPSDVGDPATIFTSNDHDLSDLETFGSFGRNKPSISKTKTKNVDVSWNIPLMKVESIKEAVVVTTGKEERVKELGARSDKELAVADELMSDGSAESEEENLLVIDVSSPKPLSDDDSTNQKSEKVKSKQNEDGVRDGIQDKSISDACSVSYLSVSTPTSASFISTTDTALSTHTTDTALSTRTADTDESTRTAETAESTHTTDTTLSTHSTDTAVSTHITDTAVSTRTADTAESTRTAGTALSTHTTDTAVSTHTTDTALSTRTADTAESTRTADTALSTHTTDTALSTRTADTAVSTHTTDTAVSTRTADTAESTRTADTALSTHTTDTPVSTRTADTAESTRTADTALSARTTDTAVSTHTTDPAISNCTPVTALSKSTTGITVSIINNDPAISISTTNQTLSNNTSDPALSVSTADAALSVSTADAAVSKSTTDPLVSIITNCSSSLAKEAKCPLSNTTTASDVVNTPNASLNTITSIAGETTLSSVDQASYTSRDSDKKAKSDSVPDPCDTTELHKSDDGVSLSDTEHDDEELKIHAEMSFVKRQSLRLQSKRSWLREGCKSALSLINQSAGSDVISESDVGEATAVKKKRLSCEPEVGSVNAGSLTSSMPWKEHGETKPQEADSYNATNSETETGSGGHVVTRARASKRKSTPDISDQTTTTSSPKQLRPRRGKQESNKQVPSSQGSSSSADDGGQVGDRRSNKGVINKEADPMVAETQLASTNIGSTDCQGVVKETPSNQVKLDSVGPSMIRTPGNKTGDINSPPGANYCHQTPGFNTNRKEKASKTEPSKGSTDYKDSSSSGNKQAANTGQNPQQATPPRGSKGRLQLRSREVPWNDPLEAIMQSQRKLLMKSEPKPLSDLTASPRTESKPTEQRRSHTALENQKQWEMIENPNDYIPPEGHTNISYDLWQLGDLRVMIRCKYHGVYKPTKKSPELMAHLMPKMEYQPQYGCEQVTYSEAARSWTAAAIRQKCNVVRARVNAFTSEMLSVQALNLEQLQQAKSAFHPGCALPVMLDMFKKLTSLDKGHYLLTHSPGNAQAQIKKTTPSKWGVYNLHLAFAGGSASDTRELCHIPWVPIDPTLMSMFHHKYRRVPATFEPKDSKLLHTKHFSQNKHHKVIKKKKKKNKKIKVVKC